MNQSDADFIEPDLEWEDPPGLFDDLIITSDLDFKAREHIPMSRMTELVTNVRDIVQFYRNHDDMFLAIVAYADEFHFPFLHFKGGDAHSVEFVLLVVVEGIEEP